MRECGPNEVWAMERRREGEIWSRGYYLEGPVVSQELSAAFCMRLLLRSYRMRVRIAIHPIVDEEGGRRIAVFQRAGGGYMYAEEERVCQGDTAESTWISQFDHDTRSGVYYS